MAGMPRVYGDAAAFKRALGRHLSSGEALLDHLVGVKREMERAKDSRILASVLEVEWTSDVERWRRRVAVSIHRHLADGAGEALPAITRLWPPDDGKPRHARSISQAEPWLQEATAQLKSLRDALGIRRNVPAQPLAASSFAELWLSGIVDEPVIKAHERDMREPRTPKQLADAIGAAKELTEATLRGALDRLNVQWAKRDKLQALMSRWREAVKPEAAPLPDAASSLDSAEAALGNLVAFLAAWRNEYGRGHGKPRFPPSLRRRHALLAIDAAKTTIRFVVLTLDDLELLPPYGSRGTQPGRAVAAAHSRRTNGNTLRRA